MFVNNFGKRGPIRQSQFLPRDTMQQFTYRLAIKDLSAAAAAESCCAEQCTGITQRSSDAAAATAAFVVAIGNGINACINELPVLTN